jgi:hypothetical protein
MEIPKRVFFIILYPIIAILSYLLLNILANYLTSIIFYFFEGGDDVFGPSAWAAFRALFLNTVFAISLIEIFEKYVKKNISLLFSLILILFYHYILCCLFSLFPAGFNEIFESSESRLRLSILEVFTDFNSFIIGFKYLLENYLASTIGYFFGVIISIPIIIYWTFKGHQEG